MEQTEKENKSIFVERKRVTLAMKLVCTFAMTYYILFFSFWTYIVFNYKTVFAEGYVNNTLNNFVIEHHYTLCLIKWALVTLIVISLLLVFLKKRYGKFLFMLFTILLVVCQYYTADTPAWEVYILELVIVLIIAPLRVIAKFTDIIQTETQKINPFKEEK